MSQQSYPMKNSGMMWLWLALLVFIFDQITKFLVIEHIQYFEFIPILPVFNLTHVHNYGAAFSFLSDAGGWQRWFFTGLAVFASCLILSWLKYTHKSQKVLCISLVLIMGGALGNLFDRLYHGFVVDFLDFYWGTAHFPAFNIADISITLGAGLMFIYTIWIEPKEAEQLAALNDSAQASDQASKV